MLFRQLMCPGTSDAEPATDVRCREEVIDDGPRRIHSQRSLGQEADGAAPARAAISCDEACDIRFAITEAEARMTPPPLDTESEIQLNAQAISPWVGA